VRYFVFCVTVQRNSAIGRCVVLAPINRQNPPNISHRFVPDLHPFVPSIKNLYSLLFTQNQIPRSGAVTTERLYWIRSAWCFSKPLFFGLPKCNNSSMVVITLYYYFIRVYNSIFLFNKITFLYFTE